MPHLILAINPGSTSTKIGLFRDSDAVFMKTIEHDRQELMKFSDIPGQREFRYKFVLDALEESGISPKELSGVVGIGGLMPTIETGGYIVNDLLANWVSEEKGGSHASNLGALLADLVAKKAGVNAYIYDAVSAGQLPEIAMTTGYPEIRRKSLSHALNSRAQSIEYAKKIGKNFEELNLIIAHLGGGISLSAYEKGALVDSVGDDFGPFSPERAGAAPLMEFVNVFYDSGLDKKALVKKMRGAGGIMAHLGTTDIRTVEEMANNGDEKAKTILHAMCYNVAKSIGSLAVVLNGDIDAVILTGGIAKSYAVTELITNRVKFIAPVEIMPGEYELEALAAGCLRIILGEEKAKTLVDITEEGIGVSE